jgi:predicted DNA-binding protein (UPF0251 family)
MPRPKLPRTIHSPPPVDRFKPSGAGQEGEVTLSFEEFEAIRLSDFEGLGQAQGAVQMGVSRQTFGRVLKSARFAVSKALVKGFQLKVTGGCYRVRGHGHAHGQVKGAGGQRRGRSGINCNRMEQQMEDTGGSNMIENSKPLQQQDNNNSNRNPGVGQGQGKGQGGGQGSGGGKGGGKGRGRGLGGGKGDGSGRRS